MPLVLIPIFPMNTKSRPGMTLSGSHRAITTLCNGAPFMPFVLVIPIFPMNTKSRLGPDSRTDQAINAFWFRRLNFESTVSLVNHLFATVKLAMLTKRCMRGEAVCKVYGVGGGADSKS